jgi:hypothetical protein
MSTTTPAPTLNGQVIGQAHYATRALLNRLLESTGTSHHQWIAVNLTAVNGGAIGRAELVERMAHGLKIDAGEFPSVIDGLCEAELLRGEGPELRLTDAGWDLYQRVRDGIGGIAALLYGDLPAADLATAGRVLALVTDRANAELSAT